MADNAIQAPIPLQGKGYINHFKGNWQPGEYRRLSNCDIESDGVIRNRQPVLSAGSDPLINPQGIVGHSGSGIVALSKVKQIYARSTSTSVMWDPTLLPIPAGATSFHKIIRFFKYNKKYYWITLEYNSTAATYNICAYWIAVNGVEPNVVTFASLTRVVLLSGSTTFSWPIITAVYMHKDRLWISTQDTVYFSKATDPLIFTVPDGGFLSPPDATIRDTFALNDTVYILCDGQTIIYTYSVVPSDGYMRVISKDTGGSNGVVHKNTPYMINSSGLFALTNGNVEKILDRDSLILPSYSGSYDNFSFRLETFRDHLIIVSRTQINYDNLNPANFEYYNNIGNVYKYNPEVDFNGVAFNNYNVFLFNTETQVLSTLDYTDKNDVANIQSRGYVVDVYNNPEKDLSGSANLFLLTTAITNSPTVPITSKGYVYKISTSPSPYQADEAYNNIGVLKRYKVRYDVEFEGFSPDGNEYLNKHFMFLQAMGKIPERDFQVSIAYEDNPYKAPIVVKNGNYPNQKLHSPVKIRLNQRASSISIRFNVADPLTEMGSNIYDQLEISDLRLMYTYTGRGRVHPSLDYANLGKNY